MNRYVAFLDILGFASMVKEEPLSSVLHRVKTALQSVEISKQAAPLVGFDGINVRPIKFFSFSDTFVVLSDDDSPGAFLSFFIGVTLLTRTLFVQALPVRGAITFGEADFVPGTDHAVGKAIIAAAELEKKQEWFGVLLDENSLPISSRSVTNRPEFALALTRWDVPLKEGILSQALVVNWRYNLTAQHGTKSLFRVPTCDSGKLKLANTLAFATGMRQRNAHEGPTTLQRPDGSLMFAPWLMPVSSVMAGTTVTSHGDAW